MNGWHRIFWRNRSSTTQSHTFAALVRLSTITHNLLTFNISEISTNISEKLSPLANKHLWTYTRLILVPGCRVARSAATTFALFSHQKKTKSCPGSKFTCNFALSSNTKPTIKRFKRGSKQGDPLVGCRLKFSFFVGSRLKFSIFDGCRQISVKM